MVMGLPTRRWHATGAEGPSGSERWFSVGRVRADQVDRCDSQCVGKAAQRRRPWLAPRVLKPHQGVAADAGAIGELLLSQGSLETSAPETAEGDHGRRLPPPQV